MEELCAMGFDESTVVAVLRKFNNNFENALEYLLSNDTTTGLEDKAELAVGPMVLNISQYTFSDVGSSACTIIAVTVLEILLKSLRNNADIRNMSMLSEGVILGVTLYNEIPLISRQHLAVDELESDILKGLQSIGAPIQGIVSNVEVFLTLFRDARIYGSDGTKHIGIVLTKTPETICVVIPPTNPANGDHTYALFDSHSRPNFGYDGAYLLTGSESEIAQHLNRLFPAIDFGYDSDMAQLQYNMFEASVFQLNE